MVAEATDTTVYPSGMKLALIMVSIYVAMFLVALDRLIISTVIPQITNDFQSAGDIGWYGTAYMLTLCAFQLVFGKIYQNFSVKTVFLSAILLFEVGSALCGAAPSSIAFIIGRALAGLGAGGIFAGALVIIVHSVPLHNRPKFQGLFGAVFGISSITGPLIGGAFTDHATWRWCFYLNLPLGGVVLVVIFFILDLPASPESHKRTLHEKFRQMNVPGVIALLPAIVCLCLGLQWGGTKYAWSNGRIIALLVLAGVLLIVFSVIQVVLPDQATVPPRIFVQRSILSGFLCSCCTGAHMTLMVYYLPLWFQAIQGVSPVSSAVHLLPMLLGMLVATVGTGFTVSRLGYYTPFLWVGSCLSVVGAGLLTTLKVDSPSSHWIGFQVVYGLGLGASTQAPNMAAQTVLPKADVAIGASLMFFGQQLFSAVFATVGTTALDNQLATRLQSLNVNISPEQIQTTGATDLLENLPSGMHAAALVAYNAALRVCFIIALGMAALSVLGALGMEWQSVKKDINKNEKVTDEEAVDIETSKPREGEKL
ncbi:hypothetical protein Sste5346_004378 [Sporothrix stenoceras]|uniref:Major facilitator superfamily (MFS) profile domain-containing protein n=1 Tax=Sporothrix stenoceras TaxID=5173 RepID=A0ABR3Z7V8_9PEZI